MHLLVIRHALAEEAAPEGVDSARELTRDGIRAYRDVVRGLRALGWRLDRVLTSPWQRAQQTATLLKPISADGPIATELLCQAPNAELLALLADTSAVPKKRHATAVVGHEPWLGELVALLAFGDARRGDALLLKKGSVTWLDGTSAPGGMSLRAIIPPRVLRAIR